MNNITHNQATPETDLRKSITRILDRTLDAHQQLRHAAAKLEAISPEISDLRALCLKTLPPSDSTIESIIPGMTGICAAIDTACLSAKTPIGCNELAKAAVFSAIWNRLTHHCD